MKTMVETMHEYYVELTDTFGGQANYSWIEKRYFHAKNIHGALIKAKREFGLTGLKPNETMADCDTIYQWFHKCNVMLYIEHTP